MRLTFKYGEDATDGAVDISICLNQDEARALGAEVATLADWFASALSGLHALRDAPADEQVWYWVVNDLDNRLMPRLEGIRDAAIRAWADAGGSYGQLALAMDSARSTAQYRRDVLLAKDPGTWENWARSGGPVPRVEA